VLDEAAALSTPPDGSESTVRIEAPPAASGQAERSEVSVPPDEAEPTIRIDLPPALLTTAAPDGSKPAPDVTRSDSTDRPDTTSGTTPAAADTKPAANSDGQPPAIATRKPATTPKDGEPAAASGAPPATPAEQKPTETVDRAPAAPSEAPPAAPSGTPRLLPEYLSRLRPLIDSPAGREVPVRSVGRSRRVVDVVLRLLWASDHEAPDPADAAATLNGRLLISGASLLSFVLGVLAVAAGLTHLRVGALLVFCFVGIGSTPWALDARMRLPTRMAMTTLISFSVLTFAATLMLTLRSWHPGLAFTLVSFICVPLHWTGFRRAIVERRDAQPVADLTPVPEGTWNGVVDRLRLRQPPALYCAGIGALLCLVAALGHRHIVNPGVYGFLTQIGPAWYLGLALVIVAIVIAPHDDERILAVAVLVLLLVTTLTPALVYDTPRSQSATKHVDLVQQIRYVHHLDATVLVYNGWAGFFAAIAWVCDITGIREPMGLATFWPPLLGVFRVAALRYLAGKVLPTAYQSWIAVALGVLADPIGADYFSPQSVGYVIGVVAFGLALSKRRSLQRTTLLVCAGFLISVSHQLSPYVVGGVLVVLVVFRQVRPWWTPATVLGPAAAWAVLHWGQVSGFINLSDIGASQNFHPPKTDGAVGLVRQPIVGETVRTLLLGIAIVALIAGVSLLRNWRSSAAWAQACSPAVGLAVVAVNPYGNEGIFRAMLFSVPWLSVLAARIFTSKRRSLPRIPLLAATATMTVTFLVAAFGLDDINVVRWSDLNTLRYFQSVGFSNSPASTYYVLQLGSGDLPASIPTIKNTHRPIKLDDLQDPQSVNVGLPPPSRMRILTSSLIAFSQEPVAQAHLYAIWSPVSSEYGYDYGIEEPTEFAALRDAFAAAPYWSIAKDQDGTVLFKFEPALYQSSTP
jgi:hypothetical protein